MPLVSVLGAALGAQAWPVGPLPGGLPGAAPTLHAHTHHPHTPCPPVGRGGFNATDHPWVRSSVGGWSLSSPLWPRCPPPSSSRAQPLPTFEAGPIHAGHLHNTALLLRRSTQACVEYVTRELCADTVCPMLSGLLDAGDSAHSAGDELWGELRHMFLEMATDR